MCSFLILFILIHFNRSAFYAKYVGLFTLTLVMSAPVAMMGFAAVAAVAVAAVVVYKARE